MSTPSQTPGTETPEFRGSESSFFADTPFGLIHQIVTVLTFFGCWGYAIALWGWFIGIGLGWIPALVFAVIVAWFFPLAAFLACIALLVGAIVLFIMFV
jgi:hypothetical protein